jgi:hypothetical protein
LQKSSILRAIPAYAASVTEMGRPGQTVVKRGG